MRKSKCKRNNLRGGGLGGGWGFTPSPVGPLVNNVLAYDSIGNCREAVRPGFLASGYTGPQGLPGMSGGRRRRGGKGGKSRKSQKGGRYAMGPFDGAGMGAPWGSAIAPVVAIRGDCSASAIPDSGAAGVLNKVGGPLWTASGGGDPAVTGAAVIAPTASVSHFPPGAEGSFSTSAGTQEMINYPKNASEMNPACLKTGGGRRRRGASRKAKGSRKAKKGSRKAKAKASRKH